MQKRIVACALNEETSDNGFIRRCNSIADFFYRHGFLAVPRCRLIVANRVCPLSFLGTILGGCCSRIFGCARHRGHRCEDSL